MDHNFSLYLPKFFSRDINGNLRGEKETWGVGKEIFYYHYKILVTLIPELPLLHLYAF
jgi:hypothetical protein